MALSHAASSNCTLWWIWPCHVLRQAIARCGGYGPVTCCVKQLHVVVDMALSHAASSNCTLWWIWPDFMLHQTTARCGEYGLITCCTRQLHVVVDMAWSHAATSWRLQCAHRELPSLACLRLAKRGLSQPPNPPNGNWQHRYRKPTVL